PHAADGHSDRRHHHRHVSSGVPRRGRHQMSNRHPFQQRGLADILREKGLPATARIGAEESDKQLGERLRRAGGMRAELLAQALAEQFALPYVDLGGFTATPQLFERLPAAQAYLIGAVPYRLGDAAIEVAIADPYDLTVPERLERVTGLRVNLHLASAGA